MENVNFIAIPEPLYRQVRAILGTLGYDQMKDLISVLDQTARTVQANEKQVAEQPATETAVGKKK